MSTETKTEKAPSKKKILNKAKYAVISAERAEKRLLETYQIANTKYAQGVKASEQARAALDLLLAA